MTIHGPGLHDYPSTSEPPEPESPPVPAPVRRRRHVPRWLWPVIVGSLGLIVGISIGAAASGGTKTVSVPGPTSTVTVPGPTVSVPGPTVTVPGPTVKVPVPGPTKTVPVPVPQTYTKLSSGTYVVGTDIQPGIYKTAGPGSSDFTDSCYWATLNTLNTQDINDNGNISGPTTIEVPASVKALELNGGCTWAKIG
jgi:hypothetical protein